MSTTTDLHLQVSSVDRFSSFTQISDYKYFTSCKLSIKLSKSFCRSFEQIQREKIYRNNYYTTETLRASTGCRDSILLSIDNLLILLFQLYLESEQDEVLKSVVRIPSHPQLKPMVLERETLTITAIVPHQVVSSREYLDLFKRNLVDCLSNTRSWAEIRLIIWPPILHIQFIDQT